MEVGLGILNCTLLGTPEYAMDFIRGMEEWEAFFQSSYSTRSYTNTNYILNRGIFP
jgi:hypothetical protein